MKTSTLLLLIGGAGAGYYLYNKGRAPAAPAPAVAPTGPAAIIDKATGVIQQIVNGLSSGAKISVTDRYQSPPFNPQTANNTLSGTSLDGNVFGNGGLGSLGR
jgi:hypothetical protein